MPIDLEFSRWWCALYPSGDALGAWLSIASMLPYFVILHHASSAYSRRCEA